MHTANRLSEANHYEKNPSSYCGISHKQCVSGVGSQDSRQSRGFQIAPRTISAQVGDIVIWHWVNGMHTTTSTSVPVGALPWNSPIDSTHMQFRYRLQVAGTYQYQCNFHFAQGMRGTIVVSAESPGQVPANN